jgi:hypothetical protein
MSDRISEAEAQAALAAAERGRRRVIDEIGMPRWYWWGLALGWMVIGALADLDNPWLTGVATLLFGASHAAVYSSVATGRYRNPRLSVRADTIGLPVSVVVLVSLIALIGLTLAASLILAADGARHPSTIAGVFVGVVVLLGGPTLMAYFRRRATRAHLQ